MCEHTVEGKKTLEVQQRNHTVKEYVCVNCESATQNEKRIKEHIKDKHSEKVEEKLLHEEPEEMEIDEAIDKMEVALLLTV